MTLSLIIVDTRYRTKKPIIITTNLNLEELYKNLSVIDYRYNALDSSGRIYSRLSEVCSQVKVTGKSWRVQKGDDNQKELFKILDIG